MRDEEPPKFKGTFECETRYSDRVYQRVFAAGLAAQNVFAKETSRMMRVLFIVFQKRVPSSHTEDPLNPIKRQYLDASHLKYHIPHFRCSLNY